MEEMHTETLAVPIGTIEPDAQCIGGTGRRTPCKQHPAEVKALLSRSLSAVEIRGRHKKNAKQGTRLNLKSSWHRLPRQSHLSLWTSKRERAAMRPRMQPNSEYSGFIGTRLCRRWMCVEGDQKRKKKKEYKVLHL